MTQAPKASPPDSPALTIFLFDVAFIGVEIGVEAGFWEWMNPGVSALILLVGYAVIRLTLAYSISFQVGAGKRGLLEQMGLKPIPFLSGLTTLFAFFLTFIVAAGFPLVCLHTAMIAWGEPAGIDVASGHEGNGLVKLVLLGLVGASLYLTYGAERLFAKRPRWSQETVYFSRILPALGILVGASLAHVGGVFEDLAGDDVAPSQVVAGFYLYLPMRYMLTRVQGLTWSSLVAWAVTAGVIVAAGWE